MVGFILGASSVSFQCVRRVCRVFPKACPVDEANLDALPNGMRGSQLQVS